MKYFDPFVSPIQFQGSNSELCLKCPQPVHRADLGRPHTDSIQKTVSRDTLSKAESLTQPIIQNFKRNSRNQSALSSNDCYKKNKKKWELHLLFHLSFKTNSRVHISKVVFQYSWKSRCCSCRAVFWQTKNKVLALVCVQYAI